MSGPMRRVAQPLMRHAHTQVVGESGRGLVQATLAADGRLVKLHVSPQIGKEGPRAIEDLVAAAVNRAHDRLREVIRH